MAPKGDSGKDVSFEDHLGALEKVVADLEGDTLSLEASIDRYKEGVAHLAACRRILDAAEQRLAELSKAADGSIEEKPLRVGEGGLEDAGPSRVDRGGGDRGEKAPRPVKRPAGPSAVPADDGLPF